MRGFLSKIFRRRSNHDPELLDGEEIAVNRGESLEVLGVVFCNAATESLKLKIYVDRGLIVVSRLEGEGK